MAVHMVKVAYEGAVSKALKNSEPGPTSGGSVVFEIEGVPTGVSIDDVVEAIRRAGGKPPHKDHVVVWSDIAA